MNRTTSFAWSLFLLFIMAPSTLRGSEVDPCPGDFDADFAIDLTDHTQLVTCLTGPSEMITNPACLKTNLHRDHHVDLRDFAAFQNKLGPCHLCAAEWAKDQFCVPGLDGYVYAMTTWDDGNGPALYVGGYFTIAGCANATNIAKWDGTNWSSLGFGLSGGTYPYVDALAVFDDGTGPALYAGGAFRTAGGVTANYIAKWDGVNWSPLGSGMDFIVYALTVFNDGTGPALYAGGYFTTAGGETAKYIAKWDGASWSPLGSGFNNYVRALAIIDDATGPALFAGGSFTTAGGNISANLAKWQRPTTCFAP